jgi:hypothetical protein
VIKIKLKRINVMFKINAYKGSSLFEIKISVTSKRKEAIFIGLQCMAFSLSLFIKT